MTRKMKIDFEEAFSRLQPDQQAAVLATEGPVLLKAGPGTGKTEVLALRIGQILKSQDILPTNILCLTFSKAAVEALFSRLQSLLGETGSLIPVHTFHSFAHRILREKGQDFLRDKKLISRAQELMLMGKVLRDTLSPEDPMQLKPAPASLLNFYLNAFRHLNREGINTQELTDIAATHGQEAMDCVAHITNCHAAYFGMMDQRKLISFDDLLLEANLLLAHQPEVLTALQEQYQYVLVDEFQDTNPLQLQLIRLLTANQSSPNLFVAGDDNQSIYRFQGAGVKQFEWMLERFKNTQPLQLKTNFRSNAGLVECFNQLAIHQVNGFPNSYHPQIAAETSVTEYEKVIAKAYPSPDAEALGTARDVKRLMEEAGTGSIAVLARRHQELQTIATHLHQLGIPFAYNRKEGNLLQTHFGKSIHHILQFLHLRGLDNYMSEGYLFHHLLHKQESKQLLQLFMEQRQQSQIRFFEWLQACANQLSYGSDWYRMVTQLLWRLDEPLSEETIQLVEDVASVALSSSKTQREVNAWKEWLEQFLATDSRKTLRSLAQMINYQLQQGVVIPMDVEPQADYQPVVCLSTIHAAKGMEFSKVLLIGCQSSNWENAVVSTAVPIPESLKKFMLPEPAGDDDFARLFYVACTRAATGLQISFSRSAPNDTPSQFLEPLIGNLMEILEIETEGSVHNTHEETYSLKSDDYWNNLLAERRAKYTLSPTGTHSWNECQNRFFITQFIKVPGIGSEATSFGNLMHEVLKLMGKQPQLQHQSGWLEDTINKLFKTQWFRFHPLHLDAYRRYALWILPRYLEKHPLPQTTAFIEKAFQQLSPAGMRIKGILDRVEVDGDKVRMIDYKTGRRRDPLEAFIDNSRPGSGYWRQGMIYAGIMQSAYPDAKTFEFAFHYLEDEDSEDVLTVAPHAGLNSWLHAVWDEIMTLRLRKSCGDPDCIYCQVMQSFREGVN